MKSFISGLTKFSAIFFLAFTLLACGGAEERKAKYLEKGKTYLEEKNLDKAKVEFKNVLQIDPKFADAYFYMGRLEEENKELGKAIGNYKKAIELNSSYFEAKIELAKIYVIIGNTDYIDRAKKLLSEADVVQSGNIEVKLVLATIAYKTGEKLKAKKILENLVKENKNMVEGISLLSIIYLFEGDEEKALELLENGTKNNPENILLRVSLAKILAKNKRLVEAETYLKQVVKIKPEKYSLQVVLSSFYASSGQLEKAEQVLRKAVKQDDEDVQRYLMLVRFLASRVSVKKAEDELNKSIQNHPNLYDLKFAQINFYKKTGKTEEAKVALKQIIKDKVYDVEGVKARNQLAEIFLEEGDHQGAKKYVDEVIIEYPNNNDAILIISKLALADLDAISAINGLRTVVKGEPKNAEASLLLAQAHELNNESSLAENELKRSIEANPTNEQVHANYARYLGSKGRVDELVEVVDKALAYFKDSYDLMNLKLKIVASQGKESEVISLLNIMEQADSGKAEVNIIRGKYFISKREIPQAIEQFEKAYQKSQDKFNPLQLIVKSYLSNKQPEKAIERLQKNLDKNSDDAIANFLMGQLYRSQKNTKKARQLFIRSSKAAKEWFLPYTNLASTYFVEKKYDKALAVYKDAENNLKNKMPAQMQMAVIYEAKKDYPQAINTYKSILSDNPTNKLAANNYASLLLDYGSEADVPKALELVKSFEKLQQPALQDTLAWAYVKSGEIDKAIKILKPIVEKAPKISVFRYHLGYALYQKGDKAAAKSHLEIATSSKQNFSGKDKAGELLKTLKSGT